MLTSTGCRRLDPPSSSDLAPPVEEPIVADRFRTEHLLVREVSGFSRDALIVTFDSYTDVATLDREGYGEAFLRARRIDAVHVINRDNQWYQYAELPVALAAVAEIGRGYQRVVAYGSSMGAYAAIRFGGAAGAQEALALSPQFSIDPKVVPFEHRWLADAAAIDFTLERKWRHPFIATAYIAYDPRDHDRHHTALFAAQTHVVPISLPNSGHPCTGFIHDLHLLQPAVLELARGPLDASALRRKLREARRQSPLFFGTLARRGRNLARREVLARHAIALGPDIHQLRIIHAQVLGASGQLAAARCEFERAFALIPEHAPTLHNFAQLLIEAHHWERAAEILRSLAQRFPQMPQYAFWLAQLESRLDRERRRRRLPLGWRWRAHPARWLAYLQPKNPAAREAANPASCSWDSVKAAAPPFLPSRHRHANLMRRLPMRRLHLLLVGDSLVHFWPQPCWRGLRVFNFGIAADKTQHLLWRLQQLRPYRVDPVTAVVMIGTNNLAAGDSAAAIAAGIRAVVEELGRVVPDARVLVIGVPPSGVDFAFNDKVRRDTNLLLQANRSWWYLDIDEIITTGFSDDCRNYEPDRIHFSPEGYRVLTRMLLSKID
jgi:tetratricopeptide (TPR) repeat protein